MANAARSLNPLADQPAAVTGWSARLRLRFRAGRHRTELAERERVGPLGVQRPFHPEGEVCHVYVLHPPGGAVGGDQIDISAAADTRARALLTTPGAAKFYRSTGPQVHVEQRIAAARESSLEWLPQENIYYPGARVRSTSHFELAGDARLLAWEIHCLGLPAAGAAFDDGALAARLRVARDGKPLLLECLRVTPHTHRHLAGLRGLPVSATLLATGADQTLCTRLRESLPKEQPGYLGLTCIEDLLVVRCLSSSTAQVKSLFVKLWCDLRPAVLGRKACLPRIWAT